MYVFACLGAHGDEGHELHEHQRDGDEEDVELAGRAWRVPHVHEHDPQQRPHVRDDGHRLNLQVAACTFRNRTDGDHASMIARYCKNARAAAAACMGWAAAG